MILVLLPVIGAAGIILGTTMYGADAPPKMKLLSIYNAYTQFTYLVLIYAFIATFCNDFTNGSYSFMKQIGYGIKENIRTKAIILFTVVVVFIDLFFLITNLILQSRDYKYLCTVIATVDFCVVFILLLAMLLSLMIKKTLPATLTAYGLFMVMNVLNYICYGIFNPADGNSISSVNLQLLAGLHTGHYTLGNLKMTSETVSYLLTIAVPAIWSALLLLLVVIFVKKIEKRAYKGA